MPCPPRRLVWILAVIAVAIIWMPMPAIAGCAPGSSKAINPSLATATAGVIRMPGRPKTNAEPGPGARHARRPAIEPYCVSSVSWSATCGSASANSSILIVKSRTNSGPGAARS